MTGSRIILIFVLLFAFATHASAASVPIIVQLGPLANVNTLVSALGAKVIDNIPGTKIYLLNVPLLPPSSLFGLLGIQWLEINTSVSLPNFQLPGLITVPGSTAADWYKTQPSWQRMRAADALPHSTGRGVVVADINALVDVSHPALRGHLTSGYDFVAAKANGHFALEQEQMTALEQDQISALEQDQITALEEVGGVLQQVGVTGLNSAYSHGTLCVGIIAAIAPDSMIMPVRAFDDNGRTDLFMLAKAIRWSVNSGAHVINMSFGTSANSAAIRNSIDYAKSRNVVLVASAGNNNSSAAHYPSGYSGVLSIAATDVLDRKASFSNYGSTIFVDAPGSNVLGPYPGGYYTVASGTSFAAPAVAGTAALVRSLRTNGIANSIAGGALNIDNLNPNYAKQLGYGRIDVFRAVKPN